MNRIALVKGTNNEVAESAERRMKKQLMAIIWKITVKAVRQCHCLL